MKRMEPISARSRGLSAAVLAGCLALLSVVSPKAACACSCIVGLNRGFLFPGQGTLPSNARGVVWWTATHGGKPDKITFEIRRIDGKRAARVGVKVTRLRPALYLVAATTKMVKGARYRFIARGGTIHQVEARIDDRALSSGEKLGLKLGRQERGPTLVRAGASCANTIEAARLPVEVRFPTDIARWKQALLLTTIVDGKRWHPSDNMCRLIAPGRSWIGLGKDLLYAACAETVLGDRGLKQGRHSVQVEAVLPGTGVKVTSRPMPFTLRCATAKLKQAP